MQHLARKTDTRHKIQLGGLVKKAGLADEHITVLYGMLLEAQARINAEDGQTLRQAWRLQGDIALTNTEDNA